MVTHARHLGSPPGLVAQHMMVAAKVLGRGPGKDQGAFGGTSKRAGGADMHGGPMTL
jgi:hypothetical protein